MSALNFHARYAHLLGDLLRNGRPVSPRGKTTLELEDVLVELGPSSDDGAVKGRTQDRYLLAETAWYASRDASVAFIGRHAKLWLDIANPDGTANSNYGRALWWRQYNCLPECGLNHPVNEWDWARSRLVADPATRQAVMVVHRPEHHWHGNKDVPCTLTISFTLRDGHLKMRAHMRSSDAWFGLPYDVPFFRWLQHRMAWELRVAGLNAEVGHLRVTLDSLHLYANRVNEAAAFLKAWKPAASFVNPVPYNLPLEDTAALCEDLLAGIGVTA